MGADKRRLEVGGRPLIMAPVAALWEAGAGEVLVVGGDPWDAPAGCTPVRDQWPGAGPLAAVVTALERASEDVVVVLACDLPRADAATVAWLVRLLDEHGADAVVPVVEGRPQPLFATYRRSTASQLRARLESGHRAMAAGIQALEAVLRPSPGDATPFGDVDTPEELAQAQAGLAWKPVHREARIEQIDVAELARRRELGEPVLDVRNPDEYDEGHVPGAVLIPLPELPGRLDEVPEATSELPLICRSGGRSQKACEILAAEGFDVVNVQGGTLAWIEAGSPVARGSRPV